MKKAEKDVAQQEKTLNDAEDEKRKAEREGRYELISIIYNPVAHPPVPPPSRDVNAQ